MPRFKPHNDKQTKLIPVSYHHQLHPRTLEFALYHLIDELDLSPFEARFKNDETGAPAYDPAVLLKVVLLGYSRGILSSRRIADACRENVVFMAMTGDSRPHFATIANFVSTMGPEILGLFQNVLLVCWQEGLIGKQMFAVDGCKISANCSKEWSGKKADLEKKARKLEASIELLVRKHRSTDQTEQSERPPAMQREEEVAVERLKARVEKLKGWIAKNEERRGASGNVVQSNVTDNESAKMPSSHGVVQGYNSVAMVDSKHQVIVAAEAFGESAEQPLLKPMMENTQENFRVLGKEIDPFSEAVLLADSGYSSNANAELVLEGGIDAYIPDTNFRKRDPAFAEAARHRRPVDRHHGKKQPKPKYFEPKDFHYDGGKAKLICPAGNELYVRNRNFVSTDGFPGIAYQARKRDCQNCALRPKCLRKAKTPSRQVVLFQSRDPDAPKTFLEKMMERIDSAKGRYLYSRRMGIVEPVFGNLRNVLGLNRFTLRTKAKVDIQWKLYSIVHNIGKIFRYSPRFAT